MKGGSAGGGPLGSPGPTQTHLSDLSDSWAAHHCSSGVWWTGASSAGACWAERCCKGPQCWLPPQSLRAQTLSSHWHHLPEGPPAWGTEGERGVSSGLGYLQVPPSCTLPAICLRPGSWSSPCKRHIFFVFLCNRNEVLKEKHWSYGGRKEQKDRSGKTKYGRGCQPQTSLIAKRHAWPCLGHQCPSLLEAQSRLEVEVTSQTSGHRVTQDRDRGGPGCLEG